MSFWGRVRGHAEELFHHEEWNIGVVPAPIAAFLDPGFRPQVTWLPRPAPHAYRADPFGLPRSSGATGLCEVYSEVTGMGRLATFNTNGTRDAVHGFPDDVHLSYPYLVEEGGEIYCVPEMFQTGQIRLYRALKFPALWEWTATLVPDFAGVDNTVFQHAGEWWLAATNGGGDTNAELWLWHAPALRGPWRPHAANPVKWDIASARPGGTPFVHAGALYRPAQDCSRTYGGAVVLQQVTRLDHDHFAETLVRRLAPDPAWPWPDGCHTLAAAGAATLLDAKRVRFSSAGMRRVLRRKVRKLTTRKLWHP